MNVTDMYFNDHRIGSRNSIGQRNRGMAQPSRIKNDGNVFFPQYLDFINQFPLMVRLKIGDVTIGVFSSDRIEVLFERLFPINFGLSLS